MDMLGSSSASLCGESAARLSVERIYRFPFKATCMESIGQRVYLGSEDGNLYAFTSQRQGFKQLFFTKEAHANASYVNLMARIPGAQHTLATCGFYDRRIAVWDVSVRFDRKAISREFSTYVYQFVSTESLLFVATYRKVYAVCPRSLDILMKFSVSKDSSKHIANKDYIFTNLISLESMMHPGKHVLVAGTDSFSRKNYFLAVWEHTIPSQQATATNLQLESIHYEEQQQTIKQVQQQKQQNRFDLDELDGFDLDGGADEEEEQSVALLESNSKAVVKGGVVKLKTPLVIDRSHNSKVRILKHLPNQYGSEEEENRFVSLSFSEMIVWKVRYDHGQTVRVEKVMEVEFGRSMVAEVVATARELVLFLQAQVFCFDLSQYACTNEFLKDKSGVQQQQSNSRTMYSVNSVEQENQKKGVEDTFEEKNTDKKIIQFRLLQIGAQESQVSTEVDVLRELEQQQDTQKILAALSMDRTKNRNRSASDGYIAGLYCNSSSPVAEVNRGNNALNQQDSNRVIVEEDYSELMLAEATSDSVAPALPITASSKKEQSKQTSSSIAQQQQQQLGGVVSSPTQVSRQSTAHLLPSASLITIRSNKLKKLERGSEVAAVAVPPFFSSTHTQSLDGTAAARLQLHLIQQQQQQITRRNQAAQAAAAAAAATAASTTTTTTTSEQLDSGQSAVRATSLTNSSPTQKQSKVSTKNNSEDHMNKSGKKHHYQHHHHYHHHNQQQQQRNCGGTGGAGEAKSFNRKKKLKCSIALLLHSNLNTYTKKRVNETVDLSSDQVPLMHKEVDGRTLSPNRAEEVVNQELAVRETVQSCNLANKNSSTQGWPSISTIITLNTDQSISIWKSR